MSLFQSILKKKIKKRLKKIDLFIQRPHETQEKLMKKLLKRAEKTIFGRRHGFRSLSEYENFKNRVPIRSYEQLFPYIQRVMQGEKNVLWPTRIRWFAKSSGTTNARSKFIPVSQDSLSECHFKGGKDMLSLYINNYPNTTFLSGKNIGVGGNCEVNKLDRSFFSSHQGDISGIVMKNLPFWARSIRTPNMRISTMSGWEEKIRLMAAITSKENVKSISGVPTWVALLLQHMLKQERRQHILQIWPLFEVFFHGAVAFEPYQELFKRLIPSEEVTYWNIYNASEGFFGCQANKDGSDILLMLNHGIFYEFLRLHEDEKKELPYKAVTLKHVEIGKKYAMIISTNAGLWRYNTGDVVRFTDTNPYRIRIAGRTKHFINVFGEEVMVENAEMAIVEACKRTEAVINNFTVGPIFLDKNQHGGHEWIVEFEVMPSSQEIFTQNLDEALQAVNSDYEAKRSFDKALAMPKVHFVAQGTFYKWLKTRGKLGEQQKIPRLSNSREYVDSILTMLRV